MNCSMPGFLVHHHHPELAQTHVHWVGDAIQPSHPLSSPFPPALNLSQHQGLFQWVSTSKQVAKNWNFSFSISPSNEYSGLIAFRMDWLDLLAVQGTLKSLLQHHSSKASILQRSQLSRLGAHSWIWANHLVTHRRVCPVQSPLAVQKALHRLGADFPQHNFSTGFRSAFSLLISHPREKRGRNTLKFKAVCLLVNGSGRTGNSF